MGGRLTLGVALLSGSGLKHVICTELLPPFQPPPYHSVVVLSPTVPDTPPRYDVVVTEDGGYKRRRVGSVGKARQWHYFCTHGTRKERCKECGGSSICEWG